MKRKEAMNLAYLTLIEMGLLDVTEKRKSGPRPGRARDRRDDVNWDQIKIDFEAGAIAVREIARREGISDTAIHKRAKSEDWDAGLRGRATWYRRKRDRII